ncbi:MAG: serine/threonine-protein kinase [Acidobacteriota bacterium]
MSDPDIPSSGGAAGRLEPLRVRGTDPPENIAPAGPSGERDFLAERLALFARFACLASAGFLVMRLGLNALSARDPARTAPFDPFPWFHLASTVVFFLLLMLAGNRAFSERGLRRLDAGGTIGAAVGYALMERTLPLSWRPDQLVLLIMNAVLLGRAALVPSEPRRTTWISAASVIAIPVVTFLIFRGLSSRELAAGALVTQAVLWSAFTVVLATLISSVTFHLRRSIVRARRLGHYRLLEKIGEGGMGVVYRGEHEMLQRPTAIKLLLPGRAGEQDLRRFEREAQLTARLTNPHTVSVYDFGRTPEGAFYYVMEYLDGIDLERLVRENGPLPPGRVVHILRQVCEALAEAHGIGLLHRDIKPANILLSESGGLSDVAKVLDFGLVKEVNKPDAKTLTRDDVLAGTLNYLAPETIQGTGSPDPRSDLYALGAVGYYLLTGHPVFEGSPVQVLHDHVQTPPDPPSVRLGRKIPRQLESVVLDCLEKDPNTRPESAEALIERLDACDDVPPWSVEEARRWWRDRRTAREAHSSV